MERLGVFAPGEYYHLLGRGNYKQKIFFNQGDYWRFLFLTLYFQGEVTFPNISRTIPIFVQSRTLNSLLDDVVKTRNVELVGFCLMPNHYHLVVKEVNEDGISNYMQRVLTSFTKYHNTKYEKKGHLFEGPFKAVHVGTNEQLLYLSAYVHRNPRELRAWARKEHRYPWSSYHDYVYENRWSNLLVRDILLDQFIGGAAGYHEFVKTSGAKDFENELEPEMILKN